MNALNPIFPQAASRADSTSGGNSAVPSSQGLNNMFLQLLVAQLKSQSPLNPMDPTQFVGQLAQFSELSEVTQIEQLLQQATNGGSSSGGSGSGSSGSGASISATSSTGATLAGRFVPTGNTAHATDPGSLPVPATMVSSAVSAAQAAVPNFESPAASLLKRRIEGVF